MPDDPALAFAALEERLGDADHFSFVVALSETTAEEDRTTSLHAQFWLASNDRIRIESTGEVIGLGASPGMVSDGHEMTGGRNGVDSMYPDFARDAVPTGLGADIASSVRRWGAYRTLMQLVAGGPPTGLVEEETGFEPGDLQTHAAIEHAAWGLPETFDGTPVRPLSFNLSHPVASETEVILWISIETGLPLRQTVRMVFDTSERITEEVYAGWSFEAPPTATFLLPEPP